MSLESCVKCGKAFTARDVIFVTGDDDYVHKDCFADDPNIPPHGFMSGLSAESVIAIEKELESEQAIVRTEIDELEKMKEWYIETKQPILEHWKVRAAKVKLKAAAIQHMLDSIR